MKKLIYLISLLGLLACNKNTVPVDYSVGLHYKGSVWVEYNGGSYENKDIEVNFTLSEDGESADIRMNNIRFVPQMPVTVTTVLPVKVSGSGNSYTFSAHGVYPHSPAGVEQQKYLIKQQKYLINNLSGMVTGNMLSFSLFFGDYPTRFTGSRQ